MDEEPGTRGKKFLSWVDNRIIGPLLGSIITAIAAGKIVIQITGVQLSIGLTILVIVFIYVVMVISFYMGMIFPILALVHVFTKSTYPRWYLFFSNALMAPWLFFAWIDDRRRRKPSSEPTSSDVNALVQEIVQKRRETPH